MQAHEPYCDQNHTPRQRCNRAGEGRPRASGSLPAPEPVAPLVTELAAADDLEPVVMTLQRDAIAAVEMTGPTRYVTEEWDRTVAAVASPDRDGAAKTPLVHSPPRSSMRVKAMIAVALLIAATYALRRR